jgi:hypothetical protein
MWRMLLRFHVLTAVKFNIAVFWDVTPYTYSLSNNVWEEQAASIFEAEDGVSRFLPNIGAYLPNYMTSHPKKTVISIFAFISEYDISTMRGSSVNEGSRSI